MCKVKVCSCFETAVQEPQTVKGPVITDDSTDILLYLTVHSKI